MPKLLVLSDLDRTLFDTARFFDNIWEFASRTYGFDVEQERARAPEFFRYTGDLYDYRFFEHLRSSAGAAYDEADFIAKAQAKLGGTYLYDDITPEAIRLIDAIVTFGGEEYQSFKLSLCPEHDGIDRHIVLQSKGEYIHDTFDRPSVLIDDKHLENEILPPATFIWIDRSTVAEGTLSDGYTIRSFDDLPAVLERIAH